MDTRRADVPCRSCGARGIDAFLSLGAMPVAETLLTEDAIHQLQPSYPLTAALCPACALVQLTEAVDPAIIYAADYSYYSSLNGLLVAHAAASARDLIRRRALGPDSRVLEIASNDGYMLRTFAQHGVSVFGIDPAEGPAQAAERSGVPTIRAFFDAELARTLRAEGRRADVVIANSMLNLAVDPNAFVEGVGLLLAEHGIAVLEVPYVVDLVDRCAFDNIYHANLCYFSGLAIDRLLRRHSLFLNDVVRLPFNGGSLRLFIERRDGSQLEN